MPDPAATAALALALAGTPVPATHATLTYHTRAVDGVDVFYREAGPRDAPTLLLLLHGFPSSSRQFDSLIPLLADRWHVVAPDYPGFGPQCRAIAGAVRLHVRPSRRCRRRAH